MKVIQACKSHLPRTLQFLASLSLATSIQSHPSHAQVLTSASRFTDTSESETYEIDSRWLPTERSDQEGTPTCFAHAAAFNLQYFLNQTLSSAEPKSTHFPKVSVIHVLAQGSNQHLPDQGTPFSLLHHLKNQSLGLQHEIELEEIWKFRDRFFQLLYPFKNKLLSKKLLKKLIQQSFPISLKLHYPDWEENLKSFSALLPARIDFETQAQQIPFQFLDQLISIEKYPLPPYNLHVFETIGNAESGENALIEELHLWFQSHQGFSFPLTLGYCSAFNKEKSICEDFHAINLIGSNKQCDLAHECEYSWRIRNSAGNSEEEWFKAIPLAKATLQAKSALSYIIPCARTPDEVSTSTPEVCTPTILGLTFGGSRSNTNPDLTLLRSLKSYPLHSLALSGDEEMFLTEARNLLTSGLLEGQISEQNSQGKTIGHLSVESGSLEILRWLKSHFPNALRQNARTFGNPAHYAIFKKQFKITQFLYELEPELFSTNDQTGLLPSDYASVLAAAEDSPEFFIQFNSKFPGLLELKNASHKTPKDLLMELNPQVYQQFLKKTQPWYHAFIRIFS